MQASSIIRLVWPNLHPGHWLIPGTTLITLLGLTQPTLAQTRLPTNTSIDFQTSGPARGANVGDWYTTSASASTTRYHSFLINLTAADIAAAGGNVTITVLDAESNGGLPDEVNGTPDPTRFELWTYSPNNTGSLISRQDLPSGTTNGTSVNFSAITVPGVYEVRSITGAGPISGDNTVALNDDDNGFSISAPVSGLLLGQLRGTFQNNVRGPLTIPFYFLAGPGTNNLFLRNFDLDGDGQISYTSPTSASPVPGTSSGGTVWNGGGDLNTGGDSLSLDPIAGAGRWTITLGNYGTRADVNQPLVPNQIILEANAGNQPGDVLPLLDPVPTRAGNFTITPDTTRSTTIGTTVCHPFSVTNNFFTTDIINLSLAGTNANYTVQLRDAAGTTPLPDTDNDGTPDTGILAALGGSGNFTLCVTPNPGASAPDVTQINATSFMDTRVRQQAGTLPATVQSVTKTTTIDSLIGDLVFNDFNGNGIPDAGEPGIPNVPITLSGTDTNGNAVSQNTTTDANGNYQFVVPPGSYNVEVGAVAGFDPTTETLRELAVDPGQSIDTIDFGFRQPPGAIGDRVFNDLDGDGIQDPNEPGLSGVTITLTDANGQTRTITTDANGNYQFTDVPPGSYTVTVTPPAGFNGTTPSSQSVTLTAGQTLENVDFGLQQALGTVGDFVFNDVDNDGIQDAGEPGLSNVSITLTGTDINGNPVTLTTTTNANGNYQFTNVPAGNYTVTATPPSGFTATTGNPQTITLNPGQVLDTVDFGLSSVPGSVGDRVFNDLDGDGIQDPGEAGLGGVTVTITGTDVNGNPVTFTTQTNADGTYRFNNIPPGNYTVTVTPPPGFNSTNLGTQTITLAPGQSIDTVDFGLRSPTGAIGDRVFSDLDGDGIQDGNEPGLGNVTVTLRDANNNIVATTTTDGSGNYQFTNLSAGNYTVTVTPLAGFQLTTGNADRPLTLAQSQIITDVDYGLQAGQPNLRLVKRITDARRSGSVIGGVNFGSVVNDPNDQNDDATGWSQIPLTGVLNIPNTTPLQAGDEVTYTIYFLSDGNAPTISANLCDQIPEGTTFVPNSAEVRIGNIPFTTGDRFFSPLAPLPADNPCTNATNPNGSLLVNLGDLSNTAGNNFGFVRFRVRIN